MKVFVSGGTGYIGAYLVKALAEAGNIVHALCRSEKKGELIAHPNVKIFKGDILNPESIDNAMQGCEQAYHLAAYAKVWNKDTGVFFKMNVTGTNNVLESAVKNKINRVVVTGTAGIYGASIHSVVTEEKVRDTDYFNEYEGSKALSESHIKDYVIKHNLDVVIVSPTRVYGPYLFGEPQSFTLLIDKYVQGKWRLFPGKGPLLGNYVFVEDVVRGHILAMEKGEKGETYLLGGPNHSYDEFFETLNKINGKKHWMIKLPMFLQLGFGNIQLFLTLFGKDPIVTPKWIRKTKYNWEVNPQKAIDKLGYSFTSLEDGFKKTVEWSRKKSD